MSGSDKRQDKNRDQIGGYGWLMVVVAAVLMCATLPGRTHGLGLITKRLIEDVQLTKFEFAQINLWATLVGALFCLPCGWLIDRYGLRRIALGVVIAFGTVVMMLAAARSLLEVSVLVTLTRGLGQSMLSVVSITLIAKTVSTRLPVAMGVYAVLLSSMMAAATGLLGDQIIKLGWRDAWNAQGMILLAMTIPCALVIRRRSVLQAEILGPEVASEPGSATLAQAVRTPCFWAFACSISFFGLISSGLSLFNQYVIAERGFGESIYHNTLVIGLIAGLLANLITGIAARRISLHALLATALFGLAGSLGAFPWITQLWHVYSYAVGFGFAGGMLTVLFFTVWKQAFGETHLGAIQGAAQMVTVIASALGPLMVTIFEDATGSYKEVFLIASVISVVTGVFALVVRVPDAARGDWGHLSQKLLATQTGTEAG